jgi:hypothetical protein
VEKKDEIIQEDFSVDLTSLVIYDIYPGEEDPLKEVSPSIDTLQFVERNDVYHAASTPSQKKTKFTLTTNPHCYTYFYISLFEFIIPAPIRVYR